MAKFPVERLVKVSNSGKDDLGTGFRLGPRHVLTSLHVVEKARNIQVMDQVDGDWQPAEATIVWPQPESADPLDAALLETDPLEGIQPWTRLAVKVLTERLTYQSGGFLADSAGKSVRHGFSGTAIEYQDGERRFELTIREGIPRGPADWRGISGAPVFIEASGEVHGIVSEGLGKFRGQRLWAVPLPELLKLDDFREALGDVTAAPADETYVTEIEKLLLESPDAAREIREHDDSWTSDLDDDDPRLARHLAEAMCRGSHLHAVAAGLSRAYCALMDRRSTSAARTVFRVMNLALPAALVNRPPAALPDPSARQLELDVATELVTEIVMAWLDSRPVRLLAPEKPDRQLPVPELQIPSPEKLIGVDPRGEQATLEIARELENRTIFAHPERAVPGDPRAYRFILNLPKKHRFLFPRSLLPALDRMSKDDPEARLRAVVKIINERLAEEAQYLGHFFLILEPEDPQFLETLSRHLSELRLVKLSGGPDQLIEEDRTVRALQRMYIERDRGRRDD